MSMNAESRAVVCIIGFGAFLAFLVSCNDSKPRPPWPAPTPANQGCSGYTVNPLINSVAYGPNSCSMDGHFVFPDCPAQPQRQDGMHTLVRESGPLQPGATMFVDFEISGATKFVGAQEQGSPAAVSLFIQRAGDNWSGEGPYNEFRAYSAEVVPAGFVTNLGNGRYQLEQKLVRDQWVNVMNAGTEEGFQQLLQNVDRIGIVFGTAQSGRAHGVCTGNADTQFTLHQLGVR